MTITPLPITGAPCVQSDVAGFEIDFLIVLQFQSTMPFLPNGGCAAPSSRRGRSSGSPA